MNGFGVMTDKGLAFIDKNHPMYQECATRWWTQWGVTPKRKNCLHERQMFFGGQWKCKDCKKAIDE